MPARRPLLAILPAAVPGPLSGASETCLDDPDLRARLTRLTFTPGGGGPAALTGHDAGETPLTTLWAEAARIADMRPD